MVYTVHLFEKSREYLLNIPSIGFKKNPGIIIGQCDNSFKILARDWNSA
jgi:hypothetical protein